MFRGSVLVLMLALPAVAPIASARLAAHEGHEHQILGTVTMVAPDHVMLKDTAGKDATVYVTSATKVFKEKQSAKVEDIRRGMRVAITAVTDTVAGRERMRALTIQLGTAPPAN
jgi:hypothetical protein